MHGTSQRGGGYEHAACGYDQSGNGSAVRASGLETAVGADKGTFGISVYGTVLLNCSGEELQ